MRRISRRFFPDGRLAGCRSAAATVLCAAAAVEAQERLSPIHFTKAMGLHLLSLSSLPNPSEAYL
ncbi:unnamed protein product [Urochloa humidicola]